MFNIFSKKLIQICKRILIIALIVVITPLNVKADGPGNGQSGGKVVQETPIWLKYTLEEWGISFEYLSNWSVVEQIYPEDNQREIELFNDLDGRIIIARAENPKSLSPMSWFEKTRNQYNELIQIISETNIQDYPALIIGLPDTCNSTPLLQAIIGYGDKVYKVTYFGTGSKVFINELKMLLETLSFDEQPIGVSLLPDSYFSIPLNVLSPFHYIFYYSFGFCANVE